MSAVQRVAFRCDASAGIGLGHWARCSQLAAAFNQAGWSVLFIGEGLPPTALGPVLPPAGVPDRPVDWMVIDHYGVRGAALETLRASGRGLAVFDDFGSNEVAADAVIDLTPAEGPTLRVDGDCLRLCGPSWAPLRPGFGRARRHGQPVDTATRLFVSVGATDPLNVTARVITALDGLSGDVTADVVLTGTAPHQVTIAMLAHASGGRVRLHVDPPDVPALMQGAALAVGSGGVSAWERACLGLPTLAIQVADNQTRNLAALARLGAAEILPEREATAAALAGRLAALLGDRPRLTAMRRAAVLLTDGAGAARLALALAPPSDSRGGRIRLRAATPADAEAMFRWQTQPGARSFARNPELPQWEDHLAWFDRKLADPRCLFSVVSRDGTDAGLLRLDAREPLAGSAEAFEVSILIDAPHQGAGVAAAALAAARRLVPDAELHAHVLAANARSRALFAAAGYGPAGDNLFVSRPAAQPFPASSGSSPP